MSAGWLLDAAIVLGVLAVAGWTLAVRSNFGAVVGFVAMGLLLALAWVRLAAPDVALTEAAVGAGATGVMLLFAVVRLRGDPAEIDAAAPGPVQRRLTGVLCGAIGAALGAAVLCLPDPAAGLAVEASAHLGELGLGNPVAAVLMAHRGLDTLLEAVVLVFAVTAIWSMARDERWGGVPGPRFAPRLAGPLALFARMLPPIGIVVGIYVTWVGADAPGGKFQGGTILGAMWILAWVAGLARMPPVSRRWLRVAVILGPMAFLLIGLAGFAVADGFLAYPPAAAKPLILVIEAAMAISVAAAVALMVAGPPERTEP